MTEPQDRIVELQGLAARLGYTMRDWTLFDRALTHASSVAGDGGGTLDYESLEFLGDAVLGLAIAHHLFETMPNQRPGDYSRLRAGLVNRKVVARVGNHLGITPHIRLGKGEEQSGGRARTALVADCMEALLGAIYLDQGYSAAQAFIITVFEGEIRAASASNLHGDYKSRLQNYCQAQRIALPQFSVMRAEGPDHQKVFEVEVYVRGTAMGRCAGSTIKEAEQAAAREALVREGQVPASPP
jgi:ribonuclease III